MRRNWIRHSGAWSVGLDGAFIADRADDQRGAILLRVFNSINNPCNEFNFRLVGRITIASGCDAQLQFRIGPSGRLGVTLQAGVGGGCAHGEGPGAVRVHAESASGEHFFEDAILFPADQPFQVGQPYDVDVLAIENRITVIVTGPNNQVRELRDRRVPVLPNGLTNGFALKARPSAVRFENVQAWHHTVALHASSDGTRRPLFTNTVNGGHVFQSVRFTLNLPHQPFDRSNTVWLATPFFSQLHGLHDANHNVSGGDVRHGVFLAGLMDVWTSRGAELAPGDRESLVHAIITLALSPKLFQQGNETGEFAHSEMGRAAVEGNLGAIKTSSPFTD